MGDSAGHAQWFALVPAREYYELVRDRGRQRVVKPNSRHQRAINTIMDRTQFITLTTRDATTPPAQ